MSSCWVLLYKHVFCVRKHNVGHSCIILWLIFSLALITLLSTYDTLAGPKAANSYNMVTAWGWLQAFLLWFKEKKSQILATIRERILGRQRMWSLCGGSCVPMKAKVSCLSAPKWTRNTPLALWHQFITSENNGPHPCSSPEARVAKLDKGSEYCHDSYRNKTGKCLHCGYTRLQAACWNNMIL